MKKGILGLQFKYSLLFTLKYEEMCPEGFGMQFAQLIFSNL